MTLPSAILLLGFVSRDFTSLSLFLFIFQNFENSDILKWSDNPKSANFSSASQN